VNGNHDETVKKTNGTATYQQLCSLHSNCVVDMTSGDPQIKLLQPAKKPPNKGEYYATFV